MRGISVTKLGLLTFQGAFGKDLGPPGYFKLGTWNNDTEEAPLDSSFLPVLRGRLEGLTEGRE